MKPAADGPTIVPSRYAAIGLPETRDKAFFTAQRGAQASGAARRNPVLAKYLLDM